MAPRTPSPSSEENEEARAFFQQRVALFWKVIFFIILVSSGLGALGAIKSPGPDLFLTLASTANAGVLWVLCRTGKRSVRFSRLAENVGLSVSALISPLLGRYLLTGYARDHAITSEEMAALADGYLTMMTLSGMGMMLAIRAALIPSTPRRTVVVTTLYGIPMILVTSAVIPLAAGGLAWRSFDSSALPELPLNMSIMWGFGVATCTVITSVIFGLQAQVRDARRLGQYILEQKLGEGGMGEVYRARHALIRRPSAIKLLRPDHSSEVNHRRFEREVQLTARLSHPNTITIFDYGRTTEGVFYYAMELLEGATLERIVAVSGAQPPGRVVRILSMACGALSEAHAIGLIHRDIKPANIMLCTQGGEHDVVKVLDFGLVKELEVSADVGLTGTSTIAGTPLYMAPESIRDPDSVDARTDIYALGTVAYFLLAGSDVFDGKSVVEVCSQHLHQEPAPLSARGIEVPGDLEAVVLACLKKDPAARPASAAELKRLLDACAVEPWDGERARTWWSRHQAELRAAARDTGDGRTRTVAVAAPA
ncbi:MAG TPA: serine/threonine-protein kinase, partial [Polyangiaceae bacterium]